jgi:hypothetical protein
MQCFHGSFSALHRRLPKAVSEGRLQISEGPAVQRILGLSAQQKIPERTLDQRAHQDALQPHLGDQGTRRLRPQSMDRHSHQHDLRMSDSIAKQDSPHASAESDGARWLERFLFPILDDLLSEAAQDSPYRCLQLLPDNEEEAIHLRNIDWTCDVLVEDQTSLPHADWQQAPLLQNLGALDMPDASYDLILTGYLGTLLEDPLTCPQRIKELARVCKPGGGILAVVGNRRCPLDLTGNARKLHGPGTTTLVTVNSLTKNFVSSGSFSSIRSLSVNGHFSSTGANGSMNIIRSMLEWHWRHFAKPQRRWAYASFLNPVLAVWIQR